MNLFYSSTFPQNLFLIKHDILLQNLFYSKIVLQTSFFMIKNNSMNLKLR